MHQKIVESAETSNSVALTRQGCLLESLVTTSMEIASHVYGVEGICLNFILSLMTELFFKEFKSLLNFAWKDDHGFL